MKIRKSGGGDYLMIIIGLIIGLPILIISIVFSDFNRDIETIGTVTRRGIYYHNENSNHTTYTISAIYDCGSKKGIEGDNIGSVSQYYEIGEKITLYCDENEPQLFTFNKPFDEFLIHVLGGLAFGMPWFILSLIGIIRVIKQNKRKKLKKELKHVGTKVEAEVIDITQNSPRFDQKLGFQVVVQYGNDVFISEDIYADIYYVLDIGDKIDVYFDENDDAKYIIDIDSILEKNNKVKKIKTKKRHGYELLGWGIFIFILSILILKDKLKENSDDSRAGRVLITIVVFLVGLGLITVIKEKIKQNLNQKLEQIGTKVEATVLFELKIPRNAKHENQIVEYYYSIVAKYNKETFLSDEYLNSLANVIKKGDKIDIYLDDMDHSKYYMVLPKKKLI